MKLWFLQTFMMMMPFIIGAAIGVLILGNWPLISFAIGTWLFKLFQSDAFDSWKERDIIKLQRMFRA